MNNVISAISTPFGRGGIAVVRVSGDGALDVADGMFRPRSGVKVSTMAGGTVAYGDIVYDGRRIDDGCVTVFRAPRSYTGEDTVEISCHGGVLVTERVYEATLQCGARPAEAGEFTRRAFVAGKIGLTEAEAVMDLIDAETDDAMRLASGLTAGALGREIAALREMLIELISAAYVQIDYPDEDLSGLTADQAERKTADLLCRIETLISTYKAGHAVMHGVDTVICGTPNTGKSSLLNVLLGRDRAIVTSVAGTTRDTIEERCQVGRVTLNLCDTAGVHESDDEVERLGIERSRARIGECELALAVIDLSRGVEAQDAELLEMLDPAKTLIVLNKCDIAAAENVDVTRFKRIHRISCATGEGVDQLKNAIEEMFIEGDFDDTKPIVTNARQKIALTRARDGVAAALDALRSGATPDVAGMDLEIAAAALGEADGAEVSSDVVNGIFSRFCVGK